MFAWAVALAVPMGIAVALRGVGALPMAPIALWVAIGPWLIHQRGVAPYLWATGLAGLLLWWGLRDRRSTPVNLGMAGSLYGPRLLLLRRHGPAGPSASLIGMGLLLLGSGYLLERARRRLLGRFRETRP